VVSIALAGVAAVVWWQMLERAQSRVVKRLAVMVARTDRITGKLHPCPDGKC
jgi:hypothetical protein